MEIRARERVWTRMKGRTGPARMKRSQMLGHQEIAGGQAERDQTADKRSRGAKWFGKGRATLTRLAKRSRDGEEWRRGDLQDF